MTRIAIFSDIHGNAIALEAVLRDIQNRGGVDEFWVLGDLVAIGPEPVTVLERLSGLSNIRFVRGNTDRYLATGERPLPSMDLIAKDPASLPTYLMVSASFAWTQGALTQAGWLSWLEKLPLEFRTQLPDGRRFLGVHAAPGTDDGYGIYPAQGTDEIDDLVSESQADLICVAHTHWALDLEVNGIRVVNLGSVSNPLMPDLRARYVLLSAVTSGVALEHCEVEYDHQAVIESVLRSRHPAGEYIIKFQRGEIKPRWAR